MDFSWTDEQSELFEAISKFASSNLGKDIIERDRNGVFDKAGWQHCANMGIQGLCVPEEYGGLGLDFLTTAGVMERLGYTCRDNGLLFSINAHMWTVALPIAEFGTEEQKQKYLPGLCDGSLIGANGTSENSSGSDAYSMSTTATKNGDHYILRGAKTWVTNGPIADVYVVYASVDKGKGVHGISAFIVDKETPGFSVSKTFEKMGLKTSPMSELFFDDCIVPAENLLGKEGMGSALFTYSMVGERGSILASAVGSMQYLLTECISHAKQRRQFGQSIGRFQSVANKIVDMKLAHETSQSLLYRSSWERDRRKRAVLESAMTKLHISESWVDCCQHAVQIFGAMGYMVEQGLERELSDSLAGKLYSGTSEIQRNLIASMLKL